MRLAELLAPQQKLLQVSGGCHACPRGRRDFVPATLRTAPAIVVGEAPGETEVRTQEGFTGKSGKVLRDALHRQGVTDYALTNTIHCRPPDNRKPEPNEISCCLNQFTIQEVTGYPLVILAGSVPIRAFFPGEDPGKLRGNVAYHPDFPGQRFYAMYHPSATLHDPTLTAEFEKQVERLGRIYRGEQPSFRVISGDADAVLARVEAMCAGPILSTDVETAAKVRDHGLRSWENTGYVRSLALAASDDEAVFVHRDEPHFKAVVQHVARFAEREESQFIGFNLGFDLKWLEADFGFTVRANFIHDVQVLWYHARQYQQIALKELESREGDGYRYLIIRPDQEHDLNLLGMYNGEDVIKPWRLFHRGIQLLTPKELDLYLRVTGPASLTLRRCTHNGYYHRLDRWELVKQHMEARRVQIVVEWQRSDPRFNPRLHLSDNEGTTGKNFEQYVFGVCGLPVISQTNKGQKASTDDGVLKEWVRRGAAFIQHAIDLRELDKAHGTYVKGYLKHRASDGRLHPQFHNTRVDSMRTSSSDPNVQNVMRGPMIRGQYGVAPGMKFVQSDFNQIQLRIAMSLAGDPVGIEAYRSGRDLHYRTAQAISGQQAPSDEARTRAKPVNFLLTFEGSPYALQQQAQNEYNIIFTRQQAEDFTAMFFNTYRYLRPWHEREKQNLILSQGWAQQITGFRFFYEDWNHPDEKRRAHAFRAHLNSKCQGPEAAMLLYTMVLVDREIVRRRLPVKLMGEVHDSIHAEVPDRADVIEEYIAIVDAAVARVEDWVSPWFLVPLKIDHEIGETWSKKDLEKIKRAAA